MRGPRGSFIKRPWWLLAASTSLACGGGASPICIQDDTVVRAFVETESNVVFVTLDGVRYQEFYQGADAALSGGDIAPAFPRFWSTVAASGRVYDARIANPIHVSLPAYQSIFAGATQPCAGNGCGQIRVETFPERLAHDLRLPAQEVASFASWSRLVDAIEHTAGSTFVDAGPNCVLVGKYPSLLALDAEQAQYVGRDARPDALTKARAIRYLEAERPSFLYISLNDADEEAHENHYDRYLAALRSDDEFIADLVARIDRMGEYGRRTALIVTTDHGRGKGALWTSHGASAVGDADTRVFIYMRLPKTGKFAFAEVADRYSHLDLRPTIETLYGLPPRIGADRGTSMVVPVKAR